MRPISGACAAPEAAGAKGFVQQGHPLRHGFANRFLRESRRDVFALQGLLGHAQLETTCGYLDEIGIDDLADALSDAADERHAQASSELETERDEAREGPESLEWT